MSYGKNLILSTGANFPQVGLGTWLSKPQEVEQAVEIAVRCGYRHFDLAYIYQNQHEVGAALKKVIPSVAKREEIFLTSKLWNTAHRASEVEKNLDETLKQLEVDYLDLFIIHWPSPFVPGTELWPTDPENPKDIHHDEEASLVETWKAMIALPKSKVRAIGVSNFTVNQIKGIIEATGVVPSVNQVEAHPFLLQEDLKNYCDSQNIIITAYGPLGGNLFGVPLLTEQKEIVEIANRLGATPAQVLIAWSAQRGYSVIPKSVREERIIANFQQITLSQEDHDRITALGKDKHIRYNRPFEFGQSALGLSWNIDMFDEEFEKNAKRKVRIK